MKVLVNAPVETSHSHAPPTNSGTTQTVSAVVVGIVADVVDLVVDSVVDSVVEAVDAVYRLMIKTSYL